MLSNFHLHPTFYLCNEAKHLSVNVVGDRENITIQTIYLNHLHINHVTIFVIPKIHSKVNSTYFINYCSISVLLLTLWNDGSAHKHDSLETRVAELEVLTANQKTLVDKLFQAVRNIY